MLLGLTGIPAALQLLLLPFFPESPRYLLTQRKDPGAARRGKAPPRAEGGGGGPSSAAPGGCALRRPGCPPSALRRLRGWDHVDAEMGEIEQEAEAERAAGVVSVPKLLRVRSLRWQVLSVIVLMGGQQLSGVNAVGGPAGPGAGGQGPGCGPASPTSPWGAFQIYYYADQIYLKAGVGRQDVQYATVGTGAVNVLMTCCAVSIPRG